MTSAGAGFATPPLLLIAGVSGVTLITEVACLRGLSFMVEPVKSTLLLFLALMGGGLAALTAALAGRVPGDRRHRVFWWAVAVSCAPALTLVVAAKSFWMALAIALLPFVAGGLVLMELYAGRPGSVGILYVADLLGAAAGALGGALLIVAVGVPGTLAIAAGGALLLLASGLGRRGAALMGVVGLLAISGSVIPRLRDGADRRMVEFMDSAKFLRRLVSQAAGRITETRWTLLGRLDRVEPTGSRGMAEIFVDGESPAAVVTDHLRAAMSRRAMFHVPAFIGAQQEEILVVGAGAGADLLAADAMGARRALGVEINPRVAVMGAWARTGRSELVFAEGRAYLERSTETFHRIVYPLTFNASVLSRSLGAAHGYLYTKQGLEAALRRLREDGVIVIVDDQVTRLPRLVSSVKAAVGRESHLLIFSTQRYGPPTIWYVFAGRSPWTPHRLGRYVMEATRLGLHPEWVSPQGPSTPLGRLLASSPSSLQLTDERPLPGIKSHWGVVGALCGLLVVAWWRTHRQGIASDQLALCTGFAGLGLAAGLVQGVFLDRFGLLTGATGKETLLALPAMLVGSGVGGWIGSRSRNWGRLAWIGGSVLGYAVLGNAWLYGEVRALAPAFGVGVILIGLAVVGAVLAMPFTFAYRELGAGSRAAGLGWGWDSWAGGLGLFVSQMAMSWVGVSATLTGALICYLLSLRRLAR